MHLLPSPEDGVIVVKMDPETAKTILTSDDPAAALADKAVMTLRSVYGYDVDEAEQSYDDPRFTESVEDQLAVLVRADGKGRVPRTLKFEFTKPGTKIRGMKKWP